MLYLALSCLQGRLAAQACQDLLQLGPDGIQLTPGNVPCEALPAQLSGVSTRTHHGFCWHALKQRVWDAAGCCLVAADSVHPPREQDAAFQQWWQAVAAQCGQATAYETMYPGYRLGCGEELERAMSQGLSLAVDVSHVHIQHCAGVLSEATWQRLQRYESIAELHVSDNAGRVDSHRPITANTFGLGWAKERACEVPLVLECYMHKLSTLERAAQVQLLKS